MNSGSTYTILAHYPSGGDPLVYDNLGPVTMADGLSYDGSRSASAGGLIYIAGQRWNWDGIFGPNFLLVPEPPSFVLLGIGAICLIGYRRRKRKKSV